MALLNPSLKLSSLTFSKSDTLSRSHLIFLAYSSVPPPFTPDLVLFKTLAKASQSHSENFSSWKMQLLWWLLLLRTLCRLPNMHLQLSLLSVPLDPFTKLLRISNWHLKFSISRAELSISYTPSSN